MTFSVISALIKVVTNGRNGAGPISIPGVKAGDIMLTVKRNTAPNIGATDTIQFNSFVSVDDEIYQNGTGNASAQEYIIILLRSDVA